MSQQTIDKSIFMLRRHKHCLSLSEFFILSNIMKRLFLYYCLDIKLAYFTIFFLLLLIKMNRWRLSFEF